MAKKKKDDRNGNHYYFGELGENPHGISYVRATTDQKLDVEPRHYSKTGYKYFLVLEGALEIEVGGQSISVDSSRVLMVEPGEVHRVTRMVESPCTFIVCGTIKDSTGADKVILHS
ncbi:hypothetical protein HYW32_02010 [Candidatus Berkelbacteria bacterium]|nr:hypothetical protein [Candidatus Berkelbacteria bacterium]